MYRNYWKAYFIKRKALMSLAGIRSQQSNPVNWKNKSLQDRERRGGGDCSCTATGTTVFLCSFFVLLLSTEIATWQLQSSVHYVCWVHQQSNRTLALISHLWHLVLGVGIGIGDVYSICGTNVPVNYPSHLVVSLSVCCYSFYSPVCMDWVLRTCSCAPIIRVSVLWPGVF